MYAVTVRNNDVHTNRLSQQIYFIFMEGFLKKEWKWQLHVSRAMVRSDKRVSFYKTIITFKSGGEICAIGIVTSFCRHQLRFVYRYQCFKKECRKAFVETGCR